MEAFTHDFRHHLPIADLNFVTGLLGGSSEAGEALLKLLTDPETVDDVLDHPKLIETVLESVEHLQLSPRLYFYLITRHSLKRAGLDDPELADYLSGILESRMRRRGTTGRREAIFYVVDWLHELEAAPREKRFQLYVMAGNTLLYHTGLYPDRIRQRRVRRGAPDIPFYENYGRYSFESAARHAETGFGGGALYTRIADTFTDLRRALNDASERLLHLDATP